LGRRERRPIRTKHTHHPVDVARGNAEAVLRIKHDLGLEISRDRSGPTDVRRNSVRQSVGD
jgi:hypothetical protein